MFYELISPEIEEMGFICMAMKIEVARIMHLLATLKTKFLCNKKFVVKLTLIQFTHKLYIIAIF